MAMHYLTGCCVSLGLLCWQQMPAIWRDVQKIFDASAFKLIS